MANDRLFFSVGHGAPPEKSGIAFTKSPASDGK